MNAIVNIDRFGTRYICAACGFELVESSDSNTVLIHPTHDAGFFSKGPSIKCQHIGKSYRVPTVALEEIPATRQTK